MDTTLKAFLRYDLYNNKICVLLEAPTMGEYRSVVTTLTLENKPDGSIIEPSFYLDKESAQGIFNQLWQEGFRPKDGTGNTGHIASLQYHLEDMRRLVFKDKNNP